MPSSSRHNGDTVHLLERRLTGAYQLERGSAQQAYARLMRELLQLAHRSAADDRLAYLVIEDHELADRLAAAVAGATAVLAALPFAEAVGGGGGDRHARLLEQAERGQKSLAALPADDAHQPLREHAREGGDETVGVHPHVQEAAHDVEHVVGVYGGEDEVPGERGLDGNLRRLRVADLAHHDLVRVVTQDGAQPAREREALLLVHGDLQHPGQLVLDRILDGDDLVASGLGLGDRPVQRGRLAAAGRSGDEQHAVGKRAQLAQLGDDRRVEAEDVQAQAAHLGERLLVEHAQDRVFAEDARDDRDAEIDRAILEGDLEAAVLRHAPLRDVELRHHLDAR